MLEGQGGMDFTREPKTIWDIPTKEAMRMIEEGICRKYTDEKDMELTYKTNLKEVNLELQAAYEENKKLTIALKGASDIEPYKRKIKSLNNELRKAKGRKTSKKKSKRT